jgi:hypothetical protein
VPECLHTVTTHPPNAALEPARNVAQPLLPDGVRLGLELIEERAFDSGLLYARYRTR